MTMSNATQRMKERHAGPGAVWPCEPVSVADGAAWIREAPGDWWVAHTRARNEKVVADRLRRGGVLHYLPLVTTRRTYQKSTATFEVPLFPGYVFFCGGAEAREAVLRTNRIAGLIDVADQERFRRELADIHTVVESGAAVELSTAVKVGQRCRITTGPFAGVEGIVERRDQRWRMHLAVTLVGQSAIIEVDAAVLEPID